MKASSDWSEALSMSNGNDGRLTSLAHTQLEAYPWFKVWLQGTYWVHNARLYQRYPYGKRIS